MKPKKYMGAKSIIPRPEYPNPQFERKEWMNLNGEWEFEKDPGDSGESRGLHKTSSFSEKIIVPFCMESPLSGIGYKDFCNAVWYRRAFVLPDDFAGENKRVFLHIGACDYRTTVYVNGEIVGIHTGGFVSFAIEITKSLHVGENILTIRAQDDVRSGKQPSGKQSSSYESFGCFYTRTTGIWQTVWLESTPKDYIRSIRVFPDLKTSSLLIEAKVELSTPMQLTAIASYYGTNVGKVTVQAEAETVIFRLPLSELHLWEPGKGELYDLTLLFGEDTVKSYFGMRTVEVREGAIYINGKPIFQRLVLDQGFYPDGIYTAPDDGELLGDIQRSMKMGFNGARLHQKIFEPRFLYHCDCCGYLVWEEHGDWGADFTKDCAWKFFHEWEEAVMRDFNHPSIIGWCPFNEMNDQQSSNDHHRYGYELTKRLDPTRPVIEVSGWSHQAGVGDIVDWHDYNQSPEKFRECYLQVAEGKTVSHILRQPQGIRPTFISEYGGIFWDVEGNGWGYGKVKTEEEFKERFKGLTEALLQNPFICGFCYTQLTDVEQEVNGLYTYHREPKFDPTFFYHVLTQEAAMEKERQNLT